MQDHCTLYKMKYLTYIGRTVKMNLHRKALCKNSGSKSFKIVGSIQKLYLLEVHHLHFYSQTIITKQVYTRIEEKQNTKHKHSTFFWIFFFGPEEVKNLYCVKVVTDKTCEKCGLLGGS